MKFHLLIFLVKHDRVLLLYALNNRLLCFIESLTSILDFALCDDLIISKQVAQLRYFVLFGAHLGLPQLLILHLLLLPAMLCSVEFFNCAVTLGLCNLALLLHLLHQLENLLDFIQVLLGSDCGSHVLVCEERALQELPDGAVVVGCARLRLVRGSHARRVLWLLQRGPVSLAQRQIVDREKRLLGLSIRPIARHVGSVVGLVCAVRQYRWLNLVDCHLRQRRLLICIEGSTAAFTERNLHERGELGLELLLQVASIAELRVGGLHVDLRVVRRLQHHCRRPGRRQAHRPINESTRCQIALRATLVLRLVIFPQRLASVLLNLALLTATIATIPALIKGLLLEHLHGLLELLNLLLHLHLAVCKLLRVASVAAPLLRSSLGWTPVFGLR